MKKPTLRSGSTLVEVIVSVAIISIVVLAVSSVFVFNLQAITLTKSRSVALALANEKLEELKNLPYDSLATQSGAIYPPGTIADTQTITRNNIGFTVKIIISYVDDPYDGNVDGTVSGKPKDLYPYDYKKLTIEVYLKKNNQLLSRLSSDSAGRVAETATNTGIIEIKVIDANGQPVAGADVNITNTNPNPDVSITTFTDSLGQVVIPKLPPDPTNSYHISVSKAGYSTDQTYATSAQLPSPTQQNFSLQSQTTVTKTFSIDQLINTLAIHVVDTNGANAAGIPVSIHGLKELNTSPTVYKYTSSATTDANGLITLSSIEWDSFQFSIPGFKIITATPYAPISVSPTASASITLRIGPNNTTLPIIFAVSPDSGATNTSDVTLDIDGDNFDASTTIILKKSGHPDIPATAISVPNSQAISGTFDLTGAEPGDWDIVITKGGQTTTQTGGFHVTN